MDMPQRRTARPVGQTNSSPQESIDAALDRLVREGRISGAQVAQYRVWEAARPAPEAPAERFRAWMSGRPSFPGLPPVEMPAGTPPVQRPVAAPATGASTPPSRPTAGLIRPIAPAEAPAAPSEASTLEILQKLVKEGRVTRAQLERYKTWEAQRPGIDAGRAKFDAWTKARPDIPHLEEYLKENQKTIIAPPPGARADSRH